MLFPNFSETLGKVVEHACKEAEINPKVEEASSEKIASNKVHREL
jgi:hypothetical protein